MIDDRWPMAEGRWPMIDGRGPMIEGRWPTDKSSMTGGQIADSYYGCTSEQAAIISLADDPGMPCFESRSTDNGQRTTINRQRSTDNDHQSSTIRCLNAAKDAKKRQRGKKLSILQAV